MKKNLTFLIVISIFFSACSKYPSLPSVDKNNISSKKEYEKKIDNLAIIYTMSNMKAKRNDNLSACMKEIKDTFSLVKRKNSFLKNELQLRDITTDVIDNIDENSTRLLKIDLRSFNTKDRFFCSAGQISLVASLYDIKDLSKQWESKEKSKKILMLSQLESKNLIYQKEFFLEFDSYQGYKTKEFKSFKKENEKNKNKTINTYVKNLISNLNNQGLLPKISKTQSEIDEKEKVLLSKKITSYECINGKKSKIYDTYHSSTGVLCIGDLSFSNVNDLEVKNLNTMLDIAAYVKTYSLDNQVCKKIVSSSITGPKEQELDFRYDFKEQVLGRFSNACKTEAINGVNFIACDDVNQKKYFLSDSKLVDKRVDSKYLLEMNKQCFNKFKSEFKNKNQEPLWRTRFAKVNEKDSNKDFEKTIFYTTSKNAMMNKSFYDRLTKGNMNNQRYIVGIKRNFSTPGVTSYYFKAKKTPSGKFIGLELEFMK